MSGYSCPGLSSPAPCPLLQVQVGCPSLPHPGISGQTTFLCVDALAQSRPETHLLPSPWREDLGGVPTLFSPQNSSLCGFLPACNVLFLNSVDMESLTGPQAISKATSETLAADPTPAATIVHFKVSAQGITLTDNQRK